jgi:hypothetical protein
LELALPPNQCAIGCIVLHSCAIWQRIVCFLCPVLGQKEAHPQIRQKEADGNLDLVGFCADIVDSDYHHSLSCNYQSIIDPSTYCSVWSRRRSSNRLLLFAMHCEAWLSTPMGIELMSKRTQFPKSSAWKAKQVALCLAELPA